MSTNIHDESIDVFCKMLMDAIKVNPEARPVVIAIIDTLMDNHGPQESWGTILFRLWQQLHDEPSEGKETPCPVPCVADAVPASLVSIPRVEQSFVRTAIH